MFTKTRYRNSILNAHTLPGADADTDHNLSTAKVCLALKKLPKKSTVLIVKLYLGQKAVIRVNNKLSGCCEIGQGVRQLENCQATYVFSQFSGQYVYVTSEKN